MVFGNVSTGYWLGAAAATGLHWVELGRTTLSGSADLITVSSLAAKPYLMVLSHVRATGGNVEIRPRLNGDSGSNYAGRRSYNGGANNSSTSQTYLDTS